MRALLGNLRIPDMEPAVIYAIAFYTAFLAVFPIAYLAPHLRRLAVRI